MTVLLYSEAWLIVILALVAAIACWRNALKIRNAKRLIRYAKALICLSLAIGLALGLARLIDGIFTLAWVLGCLAGLLLSLTAREVIEAPTGRSSHDR